MSGPVLRPQTEADADFLFALFAETAGQVLAGGGMSPAAAEPLLRLQHRAQAMSYRAAWPEARFAVITEDGAPVGRLVEDASGGSLHIVDIAISAAHRRRGLASAVIAGVQARAGAGGVTAGVRAENLASRALFARLGFVEAASDDVARVAVRWTPTEG